MANFTLFNDIKRIVRRGRLEDESTTTIFGDVKLDLTQAPLEPGEHQLRVTTLFGDVKIRVPEQIGVDLDARTIFSEVEVETVSSGEEERPGGSWTSEAYERCAVRVTISVVGIFGDVEIVRVPAPGRPAVGELTDGQGAPAERARSYEGETSKLRYE